MNKKSNSGCEVQYETAELQKQYPVIAGSKWEPLQKIRSIGYFRATGLTLESPPQLWNYVLSQSEPFSHAKVYKGRREKLGKPTFNSTVRSLADRYRDPVVLQKHLTTMIKLQKRGPLKHSDYELACAEGDSTTRIIIEGWIQDPPGRLRDFAT